MFLTLNLILKETLKVWIAKAKKKFSSPGWGWFGILGLEKKMPQDTDSNAPGNKFEIRFRVSMGLKQLILLT